MRNMIQLNDLKKLGKLDDKSLLIVDDDNSFRERLARAMEKKGFDVTQAEGVKKGVLTIKTDSSVWRQELQMQKEEIVLKINEKKMELENLMKWV